MDPKPSLAHFIETYVAVEADIPTAVRRFVQESDRAAVAALRGEIEDMFLSPPTADELKGFLSFGRFVTPDTEVGQRALLLEIYNALPPEGERTVPGKAIDALILAGVEDRSLVTQLVAGLRRQGIVGAYSWFSDMDTAAQVQAAYNSKTVILLPPAGGGHLPANVVDLVTGLRERGTAVVALQGPPDRRLVPGLSSVQLLDLGSAESLPRRLGEALTTLPYAAAAASTKQRTYERLKEYATSTRLRVATDHKPKDMPTREVFVGASDAQHMSIPRPKLWEFVSATTVEIQGWGGHPFPYGKYPASREERSGDGIRVVDDEAWVFSSSSFHYWELRPDGMFCEIDDLREEFDEQLRTRYERFVGFEWSLLDVVRPILFAQKYLARERTNPSVGVMYHWSGLAGRRLVLLDRNRMALQKAYVATADTWQFFIELTEQTVVADLAKTAAEDLLWQFGLELNWQGPFGKDVDTLVGGRLPR